ncbi:AMP-binding protein [Antrihabitans stalactiti]|uniref:AMP-binding protein n=1 Tax=Antrihabitans stalactiti TaxID=2584121 RepID=UPI0019810077|nr:AMP-binding protein [Antrihabitans stalactiti]
MIDFVDRWATATPDEIAVRYGASVWTWAQWRERIGRLAGALTAAGIGRGDRVAFLDKNHPACLDVVFAAASLGAAVAILNWRLAEDELAYALSDSGARILFVGEEFAATAAAALAGTIAAPRPIVVAEAGKDEYETFLYASEPATPAPGVAVTDATLVIYSSGTTGRPKGVVLSQRALVAHTRNVGTQFNFESGDVNLVAMPLFHVGGICYAFFGIRAGAPSIMTRTADAATLIRALASGVTHTFWVPPVINGFLGAGEAAVAAVAGLKRLGYGAAPMPLPLLRKALDTWPDVDFVQVYGQTELSGVTVTLSPADHRDVSRPQLLVSAGKPVHGTELRVADVETGEAVATGEQGELWFRTDQAMTEYLNRPDATAETITADGWVRSGDIGRIDAEGYVYVEDRLKDMIITGGENVYGPEVERVLIDHPAIVDAAIIGVPDDHWGESVKAIVVIDRPTTADEVIAFCRDRLAAYKAPRTVDFVAELPRNASGKILKRELRQPFWAGRARNV